MRCPADVKHDAVACRFDPIDILIIDEADDAVLAYGKAFARDGRCRRRGRSTFVDDKPAHTIRELALTLERESLASAIECLAKPLLLYRLEHVVERLHAERAHCVGLVCRHDDHD